MSIISTAACAHPSQCRSPLQPNPSTSARPYFCRVFKSETRACARRWPICAGREDPTAQSPWWRNNVLNQNRTTDELDSMESIEGRKRRAEHSGLSRARILSLLCAVFAWVRRLRKSPQHLVVILLTTTSCSLVVFANFRQLVVGSLRQLVNSQTKL